MSDNEIIVPKELREFMLEEAEETLLGQKNRANKQYHYGNLHIREHDDKFLVHTDKVDPRKDPIGHLVCDAPEILFGLAFGVLAGSQITIKFLNKKQNKLTVVSGLTSSIVSGYFGYAITKKIKHYLE